jgi:tetratricopeptide (TPR) repeat protein
MLRTSLAAALLAASLAAAAQAPAPTQPPSVAESLTMRAAQRLQAGDLNGALADANVAIARDSYNSGAYALRGTIRMTQGDRPGALLDMTRAIELAGSVKGIEIVYANRANLHWLEGRPKEASADIAEALRRKPDFALALHLRARLKADQGDLDGSLADLDRAIKLEPKMMPAYVARANVNLQAGRLQESLSDLKILMWSLPNDADVIATHGIVRGLLGEIQDGATDLAKARGMNRQSVSDQDRGAASSPARRLDQYREMNPADARAHVMRAVISAMNGQEERGFRELQQAVQLDPALKADAEAIRRRITPQ